MRNHTSVAKVVVAATYTLAIALFTMGVNSAWAGSRQAPGLKFTPISFEGAHRSGSRPDKTRRFTKACMHFHEGCSIPPDAPAAPHKHFFYAGPVEDCRRRCAGDFAGCNTNHPDQTAQCKHDYIQCLAKCTSHNG